MLNTELQLNLPIRNIIISLLRGANFFEVLTDHLADNPGSFGFSAPYLGSCTPSAASERLPTLSAF